MTTDLLKSVAEGALLLDVRPKTAYDEGHIIGATSSPLEDLATANLPENKDEPIYVHCRLGIKSKEAKAVLEEKGYTAVVDLGSLDDMIARGFDYQEGGQA